MNIDAHQHFWKYTPAEYGWIGEEMSLLRRDFLPTDLRPNLAAAGIDGSIAVQARQIARETAWLLDLARQADEIRGVVGWIPLASADVRGELERFAADPLLKGVRHVVQDEPDENFILREDFNRGVAMLREFRLVYDILIFERHLPRAVAFVDRHPQQVFVLDHLAKPRIREGEMEPWRRNLFALAERENVYCKLSGLVTEADVQKPSYASLQPYMETVLEAFGPGRLMFGSDWPVCLHACPYATWLTWVREFIASLSPHEQARILGDTAAEAYNL
ncbi:MAG: amidohydrolase family protein [Phycisphaerae bacterium]|nr:amidohydrolase family protein [Phycisphaerae bacterium]